MLVSRTRAHPITQRVADAIGAILVPMGSAGAKAMAVVDSRAEIYLHAGGQYEWDNCAPVAVALAAGLHASRIDGSPLVYNCRDPLLPDLLICRPEYAAQVLAAVAAASHRPGSNIGGPTLMVRTSADDIFDMQENSVRAAGRSRLRHRRAGSSRSASIATGRP